MLFVGGSLFIPHGVRGKGESDIAFLISSSQALYSMLGIVDPLCSGLGPQSAITDVFFLMHQMHLSGRMTAISFTRH